MNIRIALSTLDGNGLNSAVSEHFGRCAYFTLVEIEDNEIKSVQAIANPYAHNHGPGQIPAFIKEQGATVMLAGGMGHRAVGFFEQFGIEAVTGARGTVHQAVQAYLDGQLRGTSPCAESQHHHHHD
ncbi:MAG: NifB/NifX family molybdenum-iron cluster-binding protein [Chloroflexota bacterium]